MVVFLGNIAALLESGFGVCYTVLLLGDYGGDALTSYSEPDNIDVREAGSLATGHWHLQPPRCTLPAPALESVGVKPLGLRAVGFTGL